MGPVDKPFSLLQFAGSGFENWKFKVKALLKRDGSLSVLNENEPEEKSATRAAWEKKNASAEIIIIGAVAESHLQYIRYEESARAMWENLEQAFGQKDFVNENAIRRKMLRLKFDETKPFSEFVVEFDELLNQLTAVSKVTELDKVRFLFDALPASYDPLVTAMENVKPEELKLSYVKSRIQAEEQKKLERKHQDEASTCFENSAFTAWKSQQFYRQPRQFHGFCFNCGRQGHKKYQCKEKFKGNEDESVPMAFTAYSSTSSRDDLVWVLDSGANDHQINCAEYFYDESSLDSPLMIKIAKNGRSMKAVKRGSVNAVVKNGSKDIKVTLKDVLFVPKLRRNLLSIKKMSQAGIEVRFVEGGKKALITYAGKIIGIAWNNSGLYEWRMSRYVGGKKNGEERSKLVKQVKMNKVNDEKFTDRKVNKVAITKKCSERTKKDLTEVASAVAYRAALRSTQEGEINDKNHLCFTRNSCQSRKKVLVKSTVKCNSEEGVEDQETNHVNGNQCLREVNRSVGSENFLKKFKMKTRRRKESQFLFSGAPRGGVEGDGALSVMWRHYIRGFL